MSEKKHFVHGKYRTIEECAEMAGMSVEDFKEKSKCLGVKRAVGKVATWKNKTFSLTHWEKLEGIPVATLRQRYDRGLRGERLFAKRNHKNDTRRNSQKLRPDQIAILQSFDGFTHY